MSPYHGAAVPCMRLSLLAVFKSHFGNMFIVGLPLNGMLRTRVINALRFVVRLLEPVTLRLSKVMSRIILPSSDSSGIRATRRSYWCTYECAP